MNMNIDEEKCNIMTANTHTYYTGMEIVGGKWRTIVSTLYHIPFNIGHMTLPLFAYYTRDWRAFQLGISIPSILLLSYYWYENLLISHLYQMIPHL